MVLIISAEYLLLFNRYSQRINHGSLPTFPLLDDISGNKRLMVHYLFDLLRKLITWNNTELVSCCESHPNEISVQGTGELKVSCSFLEYLWAFTCLRKYFLHHTKQVFLHSWCRIINSIKLERFSPHCAVPVPGLSLLQVWLSGEGSSQCHRLRAGLSKFQGICFGITL